MQRLEGLTALVMYTRMGWIVLAIWLAAIGLSSQISPDVAEQLGLSRVAFVFVAAAAVSAPLLFLAGAVLNREKVPTTIRPLGKEREVMWGPHTLYMMPIGYWAIMIPAATLVGYFVLPLI